MVDQKDVPYVVTDIISMMLICDDRFVVGYDKRKSVALLFNAATNRKYDNYSCHRNTEI